MNTDTTAPDYGEPWTMREVFHECPYADRDGLPLGDELEHRARIITCVNACAGMADPVAEIAAMRSRIAELEAAQEWQPIHDAPRDGTRILGITENGFCDVIYWSKRTNDFVGKWSPFIAWMPLPPRPAAINKALKEEQP